MQKALFSPYDRDDDEREDDLEHWEDVGDVEDEEEGGEDQDQDQDQEVAARRPTSSRVLNL